MALALLVTSGLVVGCGDDGDGQAGGGGAAEGGGSAGAVPQGAGGAGGGEPACAPADVLEELNEFVAAYSDTVGLLAGQPGPSEATAFYLAPALPDPPAVSATFATLFMTCTEATTFDPYCELDRCSQLECTGEGAGLDNHYYLDGTVVSGEYSFEQLDIDHHWLDGAEGTTFDMTLVASGPGGRTWDATGTGALDTDSGEIELTFAALLGEETVLTFAVTETTHEGSLVAGGVTVASVNDEGVLVATGECP